MHPPLRPSPFSFFTTVSARTALARSRRDELRPIRCTAATIGVLAIGLAGPAASQQPATAAQPAAATAAPAATPSAIELKAAAYDAQIAAQQAQAAAELAQQQAAQAQAALQAAGVATPAPVAPAPVAIAPPAPAPAPVVAPAPAPVAPPPVLNPPPALYPPPAPNPPPAPSPAPVIQAAPAAAPGEPAVTQADLQRALEKAEQAAAEARRTREELDALKEAQRMRYARKGLTMSVGAFWAPELFDTSAHVDDSRGLSGGIGYRLHPRFSIDSGFNWVQGFAVETALSYSDPPVFYTADLAMWSATLGGRFYILTGKIQPYVGFGFGASGAKGTFRAAGAEDIEYKEFGGNISFNGGVELYVSETLAIGADAAVFLPGGDLQSLNYSTLGAKLIYRY